MEKPIYNLEVSSDGLLYEFESISDGKIIKKAIFYLPIKHDDKIVELIFGDLTEQGGIDTQVVSNNQDMGIVLNTVISSLHNFFELYPSKIVSFTGSSIARNRLYRAAISRAMLLENKFSVLGITYEDEIEVFRPDREYFAFQIHLNQ